MSFLHEFFCAPKNKSSVFAPPRLFMVSKNWMSPDSKEIYWLAFIFNHSFNILSTDKHWKQKDLIKLMLCFAVLKQRQALRYSNVPFFSCRSANWLFCIWRNWVEAQLSSLSRWKRTPSASMTCPEMLWNMQRSNEAQHCIKNRLIDNVWQTGDFFSIHFVVWVSLKFSSCTQIDLQLITAKFLIRAC